MQIHFLSTVLLLASGVANASPPLSVGGIEPGMPEAKVLALLGKPKNVEVGTGFINRTLVYNWLRVELDEDGLVAGAGSSSTRACLGNGLCPGDSKESAYAKLPELRRGIQAMNHGEGCWAEVPIVDGRVEAVALVCQP